MSRRSRWHACARSTSPRRGNAPRRSDEAEEGPRADRAIGADAGGYGSRMSELDVLNERFGRPGLVAFEAGAGGLVRAAITAPAAAGHAYPPSGRRWAPSPSGWRGPPTASSSTRAPRASCATPFSGAGSSSISPAPPPPSSGTRGASAQRPWPTSAPTSGPPCSVSRAPTSLTTPSTSLPAPATRCQPSSRLPCSDPPRSPVPSWFVPAVERPALTPTRVAGSL